MARSGQLYVLARHVSGVVVMRHETWMETYVLVAVLGVALAASILLLEGPAFGAERHARRPALRCSVLQRPRSNRPVPGLPS